MQSGQGNAKGLFRFDRSGADSRRNGAKDDKVETLHDIGIETDVDPPGHIRPNPILAKKALSCGHGGFALAAIIGCRMKERKYGH
jgi:hypothetical protein